jgi:hypothetical protein
VEFTQEAVGAVFVSQQVVRSMRIRYAAVDDRVSASEAALRRQPGLARGYTPSTGRP